MPTPNRARFGQPLALAVVAVLVGASLGAATAPGSDGNMAVVASSSERIGLDGARWTIIEAHAPEDGAFSARSNLTIEAPPNDIRSLFAFLDEDWTPVDRVEFWAHGLGESSVVRVREPGGSEHRVEAPTVEDQFNYSGDTVRLRVDWVIPGDEDDSLVGYLAVLTQDDDPRFNVTETGDGWLGNHTEGRDVRHKRARDFDSVRFHGKVSEEGPSLTLDAREEMSFDDGFLATSELLPGRGRGSWSGPGGQGTSCSTIPLGDCDFFTVATGPAGAYEFVIDRHRQVYGEEPWVMAADVVKP